MTAPALALPDSLAYEQRGAVGLVRLARPHKRNALDDETVEALGGLFAALPAGTRAVVVHGEGKHFCAGLDLNSLTDMDATGGIAHSQRWHRAFERIESGSVPVVAALHGAVVGVAWSWRWPVTSGSRTAPLTTPYRKASAASSSVEAPPFACRG